VLSQTRTPLTGYHGSRPPTCRTVGVAHPCIVPISVAPRGLLPARAADDLLCLRVLVEPLEGSLEFIDGRKDRSKGRSLGRGGAHPWGKSVGREIAGIFFPEIICEGERKRKKIGEDSSESTRWKIDRDHHRFDPALSKNLPPHHFPCFLGMPQLWPHFKSPHL
jgi:hypothetical protein